MPALAPDDLLGAVWLPGDGHLDPHTATHAVAAAARAAGVRIRTGVRVTGIELGERREVRRVLTSAGPIEAEIVVNAAGMWAPQVGAMVGAWIPSTPVDHQHASLRAVAGSELPRDMPTFRDPDRLVYGRSEAGGMLVGGYEAEPTARWIDGVPWDHAATALPPDYERFAPLLAGAALRFPFLADAEMSRLVCHPDAMTPDANPLLGPMPGVRGFWVAAGLSLNGFGGGGGIGRAMAGWITTGDPGWTSGRIGRGASPTRTAIRVTRRPRRARRTRTTTGCAIRSTRTRRAGTAATVGAPRAAPGDRGRVRRQGRLRAGGLPRARPGLASRRPGPAGLGLDAAAVPRPAHRGVPGGPRAGRAHRSLVVREDRGGRPGGAAAPPAGRGERHRPADRIARLHAVPSARAADAGRRDDHAPRRGSLPGRDRRGATSRATSAGCGSTSPTTIRR